MIILRHHTKTKQLFQHDIKDEARKSSSDKQKVNFESKEIRPLVKLDFGLLLILPALKRRLLKKISSVAYWFLVQISAFTSVLKLPGIPMLTALTENEKNLSLGRIVEFP